LGYQTVYDNVIPHPPEAKDNWYGVWARKGSLQAVCNYYGIYDNDEIGEIAAKNEIKSPNSLVNPYCPLYLPRSKEELEFTFKRFAFAIKGKIFLMPIVTSSAEFNWGEDKATVFHNGVLSPGVFFGHSAIKREDAELYPFDGFLRELKKIKDEDLSTFPATAWASRTLTDNQPGTWIECKPERIGYSTDRGFASWSYLCTIPMDASRIMLATCVPESLLINKLIDNLYVLAKITDYASGGPPCPNSS